jgi:hypothetical protein
VSRKFNGSTQYLDYKDVDWLDAGWGAPDETRFLTVAARFRVGTGGSVKPIVGKWGGLGARQYILRFKNGSSTTLEFAIEDGNANTQHNCDAGIPRVGHWHTLVGIVREVSGTARMETYLDGKLQNTTALAAGIGVVGGSANDYFRVGRDASTNYWNGDIAWVGVWLNQALTVDDVVRISNGSAHPRWLTGYRIGFWKHYSSGERGATVDEITGQALDTSTMPSQGPQVPIPVSTGLTDLLLNEIVTGNIDAPYIGPSTTLWTPAVGETISAPYISSTTTLYTPLLGQPIDAPYISSTTTLYTPTFNLAPFIPYLKPATILIPPKLAATITNVVAPSISGTPTEGLVLEASPGVWTGTPPLTYSYQWQRCDSGGASCVAISGATGQQYIVQSADVGGTIRVQVTATDL